MQRFNRFDEDIERMLKWQNRRRAICECVGSMLVGITIATLFWLMFAM